VTVSISCDSCGMPLAGAEDHALADTSIPYCIHCAPEGHLQNAAETLERFTQWTMRQEGLDYGVARERARAYLKLMPAWKDANL